MEIKCWECGKKATRTRILYKDFGDLREREVSKYYRSYCPECKKRIDEKEKQERELYIRLKKREMFLKACSTLEEQHTDMYEYREAIDVVEEYLEKNPDKFDSSYEVLAAIVLVHNRIYSKMQYKIGRYQVDFYLPEEMVILEIDGERHNNRKVFDSKRDTYIKGQVGDGWDIIRIKTEYLDQNAKRLPDAIKRVIDYRQTNRVNWREI